MESGSCEGFHLADRAHLDGGLRVLREGGYEAGEAMRVTALPGPFAEPIEELIVNGVATLMQRTGPAAAK